MAWPLMTIYPHARTVVRLWKVCQASASGSCMHMAWQNHTNEHDCFGCYANVPTVKETTLFNNSSNHHACTALCAVQLWQRG